MPGTSKVGVIGVGVSPTSYKEAVDLVFEWAGHGGQTAHVEPAHYICVTSVHGLVTAQDDAFFRNILNRADLVTPDGMPLVWALRSLGKRDQQRVYGPTLMLEICRRAEINGLRVFLYGGRVEVLPVLEESLQAKFPNLRIVGRYSPPFRALTAEEDRHATALIRECDAQLIFVGISTPKQERWMWDHREALPGTVMIGVGAAFDFHAGRVRQAPGWMQRNGLEWFFRLSTEPKRLWRRYLLETPRFIPCWILQRLGFVKYENSFETPGVQKKGGATI